MSINNQYQNLLQSGRLKPDPAQADVVALFDTLQNRLQTYRPRSKWLRSGLFGVRPAPPKGLYLWGGVGAGKSMLMDLFYNSIPITQKRRVHFHAFMQDVHAGMNKARASGITDALRPVAMDLVEKLHLLCFDEMQISDITDAMIVGRLFEFLFDHGVIVIMTSNRAPDDLYKDGLNRNLFLPFIDLLNEHLNVHHIKTPIDYRQNQLMAQKRYFTPISTINVTKFDQLWLSLAGADAAALTLNHQGRDLHLPLVGNGAAQASFADLCDQPLGAADYLLIAQQFRALFLRNIPIMSAQDNNQAKRFVTLIDTLYEAKTQLIALAAAPPDALYQQGRGAFEFERTASRLHEMISDNWLKYNHS